MDKVTITGSCEPSSLLSSVEQVNCRDTRNLAIIQYNYIHKASQYSVLLSDISVLVDIDFVELDLLVSLCNLIQFRCHHLARHTPSIKVYSMLRPLISYEAVKSTRTGAPVAILKASSDPFFNSFTFPASPDVNHPTTTYPITNKIIPRRTVRLTVCPANIFNRGMIFFSLHRFAIDPARNLTRLGKARGASSQLSHQGSYMLVW